MSSTYGQKWADTTRASTMEVDTGTAGELVEGVLPVLVGLAMVAPAEAEVAGSARVLVLALTPASSPRMAASLVVLPILLAAPPLAVAPVMAGGGILAPASSLSRTCQCT